MFVKFDQKLRALCRKWCEYYRYIVHKDVIYYYNETALERGYADEEPGSFADIVYSVLTSHGWNVQMVFIGKTCLSGSILLMQFLLLNATQRLSV